MEYDELTGLQKFGDISVGDIITIADKNYIHEIGKIDSISLGWNVNCQ